MIKRLLTAAALAAALGAGGAAQAALITFNDPGLIDVGPVVDTYAEAGYKIVGPVASFQLNGQAPDPMVLVGGFDPAPFSLMLDGGGDFSLLALDYGLFDPGSADAGNLLTVTGLLGGNPGPTRSFNPSVSGSLVFDADWARVTEVRFTGNVLFTLDNISAVPEPGTLALSSLALLALGLRRVRQRRSA